MKKLDLLMRKIDRRTDKIISPIWKLVQKRFVIFSSTLLLALLTVFIVRVFQQKKEILTSVIQDDIATIEKILKKIDVDCNILSIRPDRAFIDFFTVKKFTGSTVGPLNLAYPKKWKGPYVKRNPTVRGKLYEIVKGKEGYFVLPGHGVRLPNKLIMGKDIIITPKTRVNDMLVPGGVLFYEGKASGTQLMFEIGDWDTPRPSKETIHKVSEGIEEINKALPYTYNDKAFGKLPLS